MDRRTTLKWVLAASATLPLAGRSGAAALAGLAAQGYGSDPDRMAAHRPGQLWPLTLDAAQRRLAASLSDLIIPDDDRSPAASAVGVVDFIDEWISAPYPDQRRDRSVVLDGFTWLDAEARRRYGMDFAATGSPGQHGICDDICDEKRAAPERQQAAHFFAVYRDLTAGGFYTTQVGRDDLGYIGNVALTRFDGPPPELLQRLSLP